MSNAHATRLSAQGSRNNGLKEHRNDFLIPIASPIGAPLYQCTIKPLCTFIGHTAWMVFFAVFNIDYVNCSEVRQLYWLTAKHVYIIE